MKRLTLVIVAFMLLAGEVGHGQGLPIKSGATSDLVTVDTNKNIRMSQGAPTRVTYIATATGLVTTALFNLSIEAPAATGYKLASWCVGVSNATAAAAVSVTVNRRTTASSVGTLVAAEATATPSVSKLDPAAGNFAGIVRLTSTLGTIGALIDGVSFAVGELGAGTADTGTFPFCRTYGEGGAQMPIVLSGVTNGLSINVSAPGAGGLASGSITAVFIVE